MDSSFSEVFLIDSNILIAPFHSYYTFEFAPEFWSFIEQNILIKKIILLDIVFDEITAGTDELSAWIKNINGLETIDHRNYIAQYADILNFIRKVWFNTPPQICAQTCALALFDANLFAPMRRGGSLNSRHGRRRRQSRLITLNIKKYK
jgi:hypothetical protein